jgi:hypothetical protein
LTKPAEADATVEPVDHGGQRPTSVV